MGKLRGTRRDLVFRTSDVVLTTPLSEGAVFPVYEVFAEDTYRLEWITQGLSVDAHVLDIGAHVGSFSLAIAARVPAGRVDAYEASPTTAGYLQRNITFSGMTDVIRAHAEAVSDAAGTIHFADNEMCSPLNAQSGRFGGHVIAVPSITLQTAFQRLDGRVDLVKIDAEGAEYAMVLTSEPDLWRPVSRVVLEYHESDDHTERDLVGFFAQAGLTVVAQVPMVGNPREGMLWLSRSPLTVALSA